MAARKSKQVTDATWDQFAAEAAYAEGLVRSAMGDTAAMIAAFQQAITIKPDYAPAILSLGSVEYQRGDRSAGKRLFLSLLSLEWGREDLCEIIDKAGSFLIGEQEYADGLELFRGAVRRFPDSAALQQGVGCCAGHERLFGEALTASYRAIELDPGNVEYVSDLGWTLLLAGRHEEAEAKFLEALAIDPANERARMNLEYCREQMSEGDPAPTTREPVSAPQVLQGRARRTKPAAARKKRSSGRG